MTLLRTIITKVHVWNNLHNIVWIVAWDANDPNDHYSFLWKDGTVEFSPGISPKTKRIVTSNVTLDQAEEAVRQYLDQWLDSGESIMDVQRVEIRRDGKRVFITPWVYRSGAYDSDYSPYTFLWETGIVYFLFGGQLNDKRLAGEAATESDAQKIVLAHLEKWLRSVHAI